jgi:lysophospholipase L1-like esterase
MSVRARKILINILVLVVTFIILVFLLEVVLRIVYPFKFEPRGRARFGGKTYRLSENKDLVYELLPNSKVKIQDLEVKINSTGFRDKEFEVPDQTRTRIICVGDSITYGWGISLEDTYHKRLEALLNDRGHDVDIMGLGVPGYNTVQEFHMIREKALSLGPDILLLQIAMNDFERTVSVRTFQEGKRLVLVPYHDFTIPYMVKRTKFSYFLMRISHLYKFINLRLSWIRTKRDPAFAPKDVFLLGEERSLRHLKKIKRLLDSNDIRFAAVIFPFRQIEGVYAYSSLQEKIHDLFDDIQVPYLDLFQALNTDGDDSLWMSRLHPNASGYQVASQEIARFLESMLGSE